MEFKKKWDIVVFRVFWGKLYCSDNYSDIIVKMFFYVFFIFFRLEYFIFFFFVVVCSIIFISLCVILCIEDIISIWFCLIEILKIIECNCMFCGWF